MKYLVRPMELADVPQAQEIELEAFPTQWPPISYKRELHNKLAHLLVVEAAEPGMEASSARPVLSTSPDGGQRWLDRVKGWFGRGRPAPTQTVFRPQPHIVGMVGFWLMLDEAHITTIGVRTPLRRRGIGELMLIKTIELAQQLGAQVVTLEVRVSNIPAQALYEKYGFHRVGQRRAYYSDNGEDALIMTTDHIASAAYQARFQRLKEAHAQKWAQQLPQAEG